MVAILGLVVLAAVALGAYTIGKTTSSSAASHRSHSPGASSVALRVVVCPSTYGAGQAPASRYSPTMTVTIPSALSEKVALFSDSSRSMQPLLGPKGWSCTVSVGADGSSNLSIFPSSQGVPSTSYPPTYPPTTRLVTASDTPACQGCVAGQVCGLFPSARAYLGYVSTTCHVVPPSDERDKFVVGSAAADYGTVRFSDPPGVKGTGTASGGDYAAIGVLSFSGRTGFGGQAASITCVLPPVDAVLCNAVVGQFTSNHWGMTAPPKPPVPATTTTTAPKTPTTAARPGIGNTVTRTDRAGDAISITLDQIVDPDTVDVTTAGFDPCPGAGTRLVAVEVTIRNIGRTVLSGNVWTDLVLVDSSGQTYSAYRSCRTVSTDVLAGCPNTRTTSVNVPPGVTQTGCPVVELPAGDTIDEVELHNPDHATNLLPFGFRTAVW